MTACHINAVQECLHECVKVQSTDLLTHALTILATHGWQRSKNTRVRHEALKSAVYTVRCDMRRWIALLYKKKGTIFWTMLNGT